MNGKPTTSQPVYGYLMDKDGNFIVDEETAPVVQQIYRLCLAGNGPTRIAQILTEQEIPTPGTLEFRRTGSTRRYHPGHECRWADNTNALWRIDKIIVHEGSRDEDGIRRQEIEIYYSFVGKLDFPV